MFSWDSWVFSPTITNTWSSAGTPSAPALAPAGVTAIPPIAATATIDVNVTRNTQLDMRTPPLRRERIAVKKPNGFGPSRIGSELVALRRHVRSRTQRRRCRTTASQPERPAHAPPQPAHGAAGRPIPRGLLGTYSPRRAAQASDLGKHAKLRPAQDLVPRP